MVGTAVDAVVGTAVGTGLSGVARPGQGPDAEAIILASLCAIGVRPVLFRRGSHRTTHHAERGSRVVPSGFAEPCGYVRENRLKREGAWSAPGCQQTSLHLK